MICKHTLGGACIVTGTSIGAGMLALPIVTGAGGFSPAIFIYLLCWLVMTSTGLLYVELCLYLKKDSNIISMSEHFLGKSGKMFTWIIYLFLFYCLSVAYISVGGSFLHSLTKGFIPQGLAFFIFVIVLASFVYKGALLVDRLNLFNKNSNPLTNKT